MTPPVAPAVNVTQRYSLQQSGVNRSDRHFSEAQDYAKRTPSCYSNVICHLTKAAADLLAMLERRGSAGGDRAGAAFQRKRTAG